MAELTTALDDALEGRGGLVMLAGEPGIGKTRLTEELMVIAKDRGALVAWGACYEGGSVPPYWPWTQAIRSLLTQPSEAILTALDARAAVIGEIVPEIRDMLPDVEPALEVDPGQARFRLFDSVTSFLSETAASQPLVIALDDLHWADQSTLDLLEFVARDISSNPMLLIGGYRDMELSRRHPLSATLAALTRVRGFQRIPLRGLGSGDVGRLVKAVGEIRPSRKLVEDIHDRTEGNPFFVTEVTRDLSREAARRGGDFDAVKFRIPEGVREAIGIRLNRLSEECNQALQTAAVIGREFDFVLLAAVSADLSDDALLDLIEEAVVAGAVREASGPNERYEFSHALIQETLVEELTAGRRVRLHVRIVSALEELYADRLDEHVAELAHHCAEAEVVVGEEKIVRYARMAGERAAASYAWVEARTYFGQALDSLGEDEPDAERAAILVGLGNAELASLHYPELQRGWDNVARAFDLYVKLGDSTSAVAVVLQSRGLVMAWLHGTAEVFSRALELVPPDSAEAGRLLERYSSATRLEQEDAAGSQRALEQALEIATHTGDKHLETRVLLSLSSMKLSEGGYRGAIELSLKALELARETDRPIQEHESRLYMTVPLMSLGDPDAASRHMEAALSLEERFGLGTATSFWYRYFIALLRGDLATVDKLGEAIDIDIPNDTAYGLLVGIGAWHTEERSDIDERFQAAQEEGQTAPLLFQRTSNILYMALAARLMDRPRDASRAGEMARSVLSTPRLIPENEEKARIAAGLAAVAAGDAENAREHYRHLEKLRGAVLWSVPISGDRVLGLLAHTARKPIEAAAHFEDALDFTGRAGYRLEEAWTCHDYAETLLDSDEPSIVERATSLIDRGLKITGELGLVGIEKRLITLQEKAASMAAPTPAYPDGLTEREVEVLRLLAAGSTNQQIADELVIASSTAAKHVANILGKTSSANRTEAATYANQQGLVKAQ